MTARRVLVACLVAGCGKSASEPPSTTSAAAREEATAPGVAAPTIVEPMPLGALPVELAVIDRPEPRTLARTPAFIVATRDGVFSAGPVGAGEQAFGAASQVVLPRLEAALDRVLGRPASDDQRGLGPIHARIEDRPAEVTLFVDRSAIAPIPIDVIASVPSLRIAVAIADGDTRRALSWVFGPVDPALPERNPLEVEVFDDGLAIYGERTSWHAAEESLRTAVKAKRAVTSMAIEVVLGVHSDVSTSRFVALLGTVSQVGVIDLTVKRAGDAGGNPGAPSGMRMGNRDGGIPVVRIGQPTMGDGLDKAIVRRYIKRNIQKIQYCYEKQLLARPSLQGTLTMTFVITPLGNVGDAKATGFDTEVVDCVRRVITDIEFPKPKSGAPVPVTYPFTFRASGG